MKKLFIFTFLTMVLMPIFSQTDTIGYDAKLAAKLGADEHGMKMYVMVILKTGTYNPTSKIEHDSLFRGHMNNIKRLVSEGKMVIAGPFDKNDKSYRGIFIMNVPTIAEAKKLIETDPTINSRVFDVELFEWYGSAALPVYLKTHQKIEKKKISD